MPDPAPDPAALVPIRSDLAEDLRDWLDGKLNARGVPPLMYVCI